MVCFISLDAMGVGASLLDGSHFTYGALIRCLGIQNPNVLQVDIELLQRLAGLPS